MTESEAFDVTAVRVIESADQDRSTWTDADRAWASQEAAAEVGESAPAERFVVRRAQLARRRLEARWEPLSKGLQALAWRPWLGTAVIATACLAGLLADRLGEAQRINVLAPPVLLLLAWNLLVYLLLLTAPLWHTKVLRAGDPLRAGLAHLGARWHPRRTQHLGVPVGSWLAKIATQWSGLAAPLYLARATRLLHLAAAALALGIIAGMYLRGLAFEYRATWESTFLEPTAVRAILSVVLAPGAWLGGLPMAELARIEAMRAPGSENAAPWLHLIALTLLALVVVPRLLLAAFAYWRERRQVRLLAQQLDHPYFQRLLRGFHVAPQRVQVLPYGFTPSAPALAGLQTLLARLVGGTATVQVATPAAYGEDDDRALDQLSQDAGPLVLVFNLAATPEREVHTAFVSAAVSVVGTARPLLVLIDETSFKARSTDDPQRLIERRGAWRELLLPTGVVPAFVDLGQPDAASADAALDAAWFVPKK